MEELHEKLILLLVDQCEQTPDMRYMIEQAIHFRYLKDRRPELFAKVKQLVKRGNLELGCGMASSIENNMTNGECFIRNMQLGARWFAENMDVRAADFEMIDTFGFPPQTKTTGARSEDVTRRHRTYGEAKRKRTRPDLPIRARQVTTI